ncbi:MAG: hypothetical protein O2854_04395 [Chloroflexi bacterium]|nr:hypothetical protein [Chloroflexota bacterium]
MFPDADLIAFTTYPALVFQSPAEIPDDYYTEAAERAGKPVAFTEIGWHAAQLGAPGWDSDEEEQAEFIRTYLRLTEDVEPVLSIWAFLYVLPGQPIIFETMTLVRPDGSFPPAWDAWNQGE